MKVFLSYASEERPLAERICRLRIATTSTSRFPMTTTFVAVKLWFIDGTRSNVERFAIEEMGVDRGH